MFEQPWLWIVGAILLAAAAGVFGWWLARRQPKRTSVERARKLFHLQRERAEHRFFVLDGTAAGFGWRDDSFSCG
jgi:hypothetical protein